MSLESPTRLEKAIEAVKGFSHWRILGVCVGLLILLGLVLFTADRCGTWSTNRKNEQIKTNVNTALANIAEREKTIANLKQQQAVETEAVKRETVEYMEAANYTDETKRDINRALGNLANAAKSNGNISVRELEDKLRGL